MMPVRVEITEVGTRDGLQSEAEFVPTVHKISLIEALIAAGLKRVEATSFVSPRAVPQLADAAEVVAAVRGKGATIAALVPNAKGAERVIAAGVDEMMVFISASESHSQTNLNTDIAHALRAVEPVADLAARAGILDHAIFISFDHTVLKTLKDHVPAARTEGILHARHVDLVGLARAAWPDSVSVEHGMFRPEDGMALHDAGIAVRHHFQRPATYDLYAKAGLDFMDGMVEWLASGVIDTISGDDVTWLADLARKAGKHPA